jgi:hypothetical protein
MRAVPFAHRGLPVLLATTVAACVAGDHKPPPAPPVADHHLRVSAAYAATLVWALDRAVGLDGSILSPNARVKGYEAWLGLEPDDARLVSFRERRPKWIVRPDSQLLPPVDPYLSCGLASNELSELTACLRRVLSPEDARVAEEALAPADAGLRPRWAAMAPELDAKVGPVREMLEGHQVTAALAELRTIASISDSVELASAVVFVANPNPNVSQGIFVGTTDVLEIDHKSSPAEQAGIVMHEIAHTAVAASPRTPEIEPALAGQGVAGVIAAAEWNEAFASAFGNGLVVSRLQPGSPDARSLYGRPIVNALAHGLLHRWIAGDKPELGAPLAAQLIAAMREVPRERWTVSDVFARSRAYASDESVAAAFQEAASPVFQYRDSPLPSDLTRPKECPPLVPTIYFVTSAELGAHGSLLDALAIRSEDAAARLSSKRASVHWQERDGVPVVLVVARDAAALLAAAKWFAASTTLPPVGWSDAE